MFERIALVVLTRAGLAHSIALHEALDGDTDIYASQRVIALPGIANDIQFPIAIECFDSVGALLTQLWRTHTQIVLFFALGAAIRLMAPLLQDKRTDPGVVVIDDAGSFAISAVSGHLGGANDLAVRCAQVLHGVPVITTASDVRGLFAVDLLVQEMDWSVEDTAPMTAVSAAIVNGEQVAIFQEAGSRDWCKRQQPWPDNLIFVDSPHKVTRALFAAFLVISDRLIARLATDVSTVVYRPRCLVLGVGCRRGVSFAALDAFIRETLVANNIAFQSIAVLASADLKADEVGLQMLAQRYQWPFEVHTVEALRAAIGIVTPSKRVQRLIGTPSVSEAAALLSSHHGELLVQKHKGEGMTLAVARF